LQKVVYLYDAVSVLSHLSLGTSRFGTVFLQLSPCMYVGRVNRTDNGE